MTIYITFSDKEIVKHDIYLFTEDSENIVIISVDGLVHKYTKKFVNDILIIKNVF